MDKINDYTVAIDGEEYTLAQLRNTKAAATANAEDYQAKADAYKAVADSAVEHLAEAEDLGVIDQPEDPAIGIQRVWQEKLSAGWEDPVTGIKLKTTTTARDTFTAQSVLLSQLVNDGDVTEDTPASVWDDSNEEHTLTIGEVRALLKRYGLAWLQMFTEFAP